MMDLQINNEYFDLVPRPNQDDRHALKQSIISDGQLMPITVNEKGVILDGHTRYEICQELDIMPNYVVKHFESEEEERKFIIMSNLTRRHLSKFQRIELAWEIYEIEKKRAYERWSGQGGNAERRANAPRKEGNAAEIFGRYLGTGHTAVNAVEFLLKNADAEMLTKLRSGEISIARAYDLLRGLKLIPRRKIKPDPAPTECPDCHLEVVQKEKRKCHVHRWFCCSSCKWGI